MPKNKKSHSRHFPQGLDILYEDADILVVTKPAGLLTMASQTNATRTAYYILTDYVRKGNPKSRNRIFIVHRLDQGTSGVLVFARNEDAKFTLQSRWKETEKKYLAVVRGRPDPQEGIIQSYLAENSAHKVYSTNNPNEGRSASTAYKVIQSGESTSLLEITLLTGRKNQIRVHLADIGCPIVGDKKYGNPKDPYRRLALHASSIALPHPVTGRRMTFESSCPSDFNRLLKAT